MRSLKSGFSLLELIVVLTVIGIIGTLGYQKFSEITENSKAQQIVDSLKKAEMANSRAIASIGIIRPAPVEDNGDYGDDEELRCYDFQNDTKYSGLNATGSDMDEYAEDFYQSFRNELLQVGFKEKIGGKGFYLQSDPRTVFYSCYRNGMRFFAISNVKGSIAARALKIINNGNTMSPADGLNFDKRAAIWNLNTPTIYDLDFVQTIKEAIKDGTVGEIQAEANDGVKSPKVKEDVIMKSPALTLTYNLTQGTKSATEW